VDRRGVEIGIGRIGLVDVPATTPKMAQTGDEAQFQRDHVKSPPEQKTETANLARAGRRTFCFRRLLDALAVGRHSAGRLKPIAAEPSGDRRVRQRAASRRLSLACR
jgi:hypothetical protein